MTDRATLQALFDAGIHAVGGRAAARRVLDEAALDEAVWLVSLGKAASAMALGARDSLGECLQAALLVTKHDHLDVSLQLDARFECIEAGHPTPDERSLQAGEALQAFLRSRPAGQTGVVLISGGTSALVESLVDGWSLDTLRRLTEALLANGMAIGDMNHIRQRVSRIKGGRLARVLPTQGTVLQFLISDVPGDVLADIGSGLLVPGASLPLSGQGPETALAPSSPLPGRAELGIDLPAAPENKPPPVDDPVWQRIQTRLMASNALARAAVVRQAEQMNLPMVLADGSLDGDVELVAERVAAQLLAPGAPAGVYVWGGEPTVRLPEAPGRGGRNQHLALRLAQALDGAPGCTVLVAGTDGTDGPTADAGGLVDDATCARGERLGLDIEQHLARADAGSFLAATGDLLTTGPTGTNVMDLAIAIRQRPA